jgi:hypothetical protein
LEIFSSKGFFLFGRALVAQQLFPVTTIAKQQGRAFRSRFPIKIGRAPLQSLTRNSSNQKIAFKNKKLSIKKAFLVLEKITCPINCYFLYSFK